MRQMIAPFVLAGLLALSSAAPAMAGRNMAFCYQLYERLSQCQREQQAMNRWGGGGWGGGYGGGWDEDDGYGGGYGYGYGHRRRGYHHQKQVECNNWLAALQVNHCM